MPAASKRHPIGPRTATARTERKTSGSMLAERLGEYLERDGRALNRIAQASLIDVAYLWRLQHGQKFNPSRDVLIRLGLVLRLQPEEVDEILVAADYAPITLRRS